jgi:ABC-2 type transport system permease protein
MTETINRRRLTNVLRHEWRMIFTNLNSAAFVLLLPIVLIGQAFAYLYVATDLVGVETLTKILGKGLEKWILAFPQYEGLELVDQFRAFVFGQIPLYLLLVPCLIAMSVATFTIVEEKQTKTLEPLLATPVRTSELLLGKALAGAIPSLVMSWVCAAFFIGLMLVTGSGEVVSRGVNAQWAISLIVLVPIISILAFMLGVIASSRASDAKSAQNLAIVVILPVFAIVGIQLAGIVVYGVIGLLLLSVALVFATYLVLRLAIRLFQRESILVGWR